MALSALCIALPLLVPAPLEPVAPARADVKIDEIAALGRLWTEVRFMHPRLYRGDMSWDEALFAHGIAVVDGGSPAEFRDAIAGLLGTLHDPLTRVIDPSLEVDPVATEERTPSAELSGFGVWIVTAPAEGGAAAVEALGAEPSGDAVGVIYDLRGSSAGEVHGEYDDALETALLARTDERVRMPHLRHVHRSGFVTMTGTSSGGYTTAFSVERGERLKGSGDGKLPLVLLVDRWTRSVDLVLGFQQAGAARVVFEGSPEDAHWFQSSGTAHRDVALPHGLVARVRTSERIGGGREEGFLPDVRAEGQALAAAIEVVRHWDATDGVEYGELASAAQAPEELPYPDVAYPSLEFRLLALFRLWGTIEHFFPYHHLTDQPWSDTLEEFVPVFIGASTELEYGRAVARLAGRMDDSHASVSSAALWNHKGLHLPGVVLRYVEGKPTVTAITDAACAQLGVSIGDVLVEVDGVSVAEREAVLTEVTAHSTPQALSGGVARRLLGGARATNASCVLETAEGRKSVDLPRSAPYVDGTVRETPVFGVLEDRWGYMDLARLTVEDVPNAFEEVAGADGLVIDIRGYPKGTAWALAPRLVDRSVPAASFRRNELGGEGPGVAGSASFVQPTPPPVNGAPLFAGPIVVLIDDRAISQSEHTCLFLKAARPDVVFVGSPTNGANGDVTRILLPGRVVVNFTGHDVRHADDTQLQRLGIQPDVRVEPTLSGVRAGRDEVLERGFAVLAEMAG